LSELAHPDYLMWKWWNKLPIDYKEIIVKREYQIREKYTQCPDCGSMIKNE